MWTRRLCYVLALLCALLGQMLDIGYLFHYVFVLTAALPLLGLALSLPAMVGLRASLEADAPTVERGRPAGWTLVLENRLKLPVARVKGRASLADRFAGTSRRRRLRSAGCARIRLEADTAHCGLVECRVGRLWVCDCLGLFALPVRAPAAGVLPVVPVPERPKALTLPEGTGSPVPVPRGKSASGEDYELRSYQPGDSPRTIHWKMSAKRDELVSRELLEDRRPLPVLTIDHFGSPDKLDRALDRLAGYGEALLDRQRPFEVRWAHPGTGAVRRWAVSCRRDWPACLTALLSDPAPAAGRSILESPLAVEQDQVIFPIHITGEEAGHGED